MIATLRADEETWTHSSCGNGEEHLPGIARLVSGMVCMLCGKLAIQSAKRRSLLPWDEAMLPPCTTLRLPVPAPTWSALALSLPPSFSTHARTCTRLHIQTHTHTHTRALSLTQTRTAARPSVSPHPPSRSASAGSTIVKFRKCCLLGRFQTRQHFVVLVGVKWRHHRGYTFQFYSRKSEKIVWPY